MGSGKLHLTGYCERVSKGFEGRWEDADPRSNFPSAIEMAKIMAEPWKSGGTYMYQEPEPVHLWPKPTRWERWRARLKIWYLRVVGMEWRL